MSDLFASPAYAASMRIALLAALLALAPPAMAQTGQQPSDASSPPACDPAAATADPGRPCGTAVAPQPAETQRHATCQTIDGQTFEWSHPNVPFAAARCDAGEAASAPQAK